VSARVCVTLRRVLDRGRSAVARHPLGRLTVICPPQNEMPKTIHVFEKIIYGKQNF
jgi:hypothetical protein